MRTTLVFLGTLAMAGCGPRQQDADGPPPPASIGAARDSAGGSQVGLVNTYWRITSLDTMTVPQATDSGPRAPHLQLTGSSGNVTYSATVGCNGIGGDATINGDSLTFGPGIGTITGDTLELRDESGNRIARLVTGAATR